MVECDFMNMPELSQNQELLLAAGAGGLLVTAIAIIFSMKKKSTLKEGDSSGHSFPLDLKDGL